MFKRLWLRYLRPHLYPWYMEPDPTKSFQRWLRETPNGRAGYQRFRDTVYQCDPNADMPESLDYQ